MTQGSFIDRVQHHVVIIHSFIVVRYNYLCAFCSPLFRVLFNLFLAFFASCSLVDFVFAHDDRREQFIR